MASAGQGARSQLGKAAFCLSCQSAGWRHGCLFNYHHHHHHHRHTDSNKKAEMPPSRPTGRPRPTSAIADQQPDSGESLERVAVSPSQTLAGSPTASGGSKKHACQPATTTTATDSNKKAVELDQAEYHCRPGLAACEKNRQPHTARCSSMRET